MKLTLSEILKATNAKLIKGSGEIQINGFSTDTRTIEQGQIYIPLKGENFDGENFIENALNSGAIGYFTTDCNKIYNSAEIIAQVNDTKEA